MSVAYLVIYDGEPNDPEAFADYYVNVHGPLLWGFPGIRDVQIHLRQGVAGPFLVTRLEFGSLPELLEAVEGPYRSVTRADMDANILPRFNGTVRHTVTEVHTAPR